MFKIYINDGRTEMPNDDIFYIIGKDGIFLKKRVGILESVVPVDKISILENVNLEAKLFIKKVSADEFAKVLSFFREVYKVYKSEAIVLLHYNQRKKKYILQVPPQEVSFAGIDYVKSKLYQGYDLIGTIHSHGNMSAFHSSTDDSDEEHFDGLHITIGNVNEEFVSISTSIVSNGHRFAININEYVEGVRIVEYSSWFPSMIKPKFEMKEGKKEYQKYVKTKLGYTILGASKNESSFDPNWLKFITKSKPTVYYSHSYLGQNHSFDLTSLLKNHATNLSSKEKTKKWRQDKVSFEFNPCENCVFKNYKLASEQEDLNIDVELEEFQEQLTW